MSNLSQLPKGYLGRLINAMRGHGWKMMSLVAITEEDNRDRRKNEEYYGDRRVTSLFFHIPDLAVIWQAAYRETWEPKYVAEKYHADWKFGFHFSWNETWQDRLDDWSDRLRYGSSPYPDIAHLLDYEPEFESSGGSSGGTCIERQFYLTRSVQKEGGLIEPQRLADKLNSTSAPLIEFASCKFPELFVHNFPPVGSFASQRYREDPFVAPVFWQRFPMARLFRKVSTRIYGSWFAEEYDSRHEPKHIAIRVDGTRYAY